MALGSSLPVQLLLGIYLGVLTAVVPALVAWTLGFTFKYFTGVTLPGFGVVVLGVALAGVQGGLLGLLEPQIVASPAALVSALVVMMATLYAHAQGDKMGAEFPRRLTLRGLRERSLSADVVERVGRFGNVRVRVTGEVGDVEGYPSLPADLRTAIREREWTFPADLPLSELAARLEERLRTDYDLAEVAVDIDERGRATVSAAPPVGALSRRVPQDKRAVSVSALVPTGLARRDEVTLSLAEEDGEIDDEITGTVLSAKSNGAGNAGSNSQTVPTKIVGDESEGDERAQNAVATTPAQQATGGDGRVTVAVSPADATTLLDAESPRLRVRARGTRREFELLSLLRRDGKRVRRVKVRDDGPLADQTVGSATFRSAYGVAVLAVRRGRDWTFAPGGATPLSDTEELYVVGARSALDRFEEVVA
ncbi:potassium channel family protein [Halorussus halophilus]|uniref:potassium channel family protein n=1 Tax=Halorussus halophilus TaxID=2650975 RepID=UPI001300EF45|nr:TrkA C-terminal domain-containing protein [Halorussus halophilus]